MQAPRTCGPGGCRAFAVVCACSFLPTIALAGPSTIRVPDDQPTIQAGIDAATAGDTVLVAAGTYTGPGNKDISFDGRDVVVMSEDGATATIIDCEGSTGSNARAFIFTHGESRDAVVSGFTIQNGYRSEAQFPDGYGGGMVIVSAAPTIRECIFYRNHAGSAGGGAAVSGAGQATFFDCLFWENTTDGHGGGAYASASAVFVECRFAANEAPNEAGGGLRCYSSSAPIVRDCEFIENSAHAGGGLASSFAETRVAQCNFIENTSTSAGGSAVYASLGTHVVLSTCFFIDNTAEGSYGGTVCCHGSTAEVQQSTFYHNAALAGTDIRLLNSSDIEIRNTIISWGVDGEAVVCDAGSTIRMICCDVFACEGGDWIGCIEDLTGVNGNISADPLFCNIAEGDFQLAANSPCAPPPGAGPCPRMGRYDVGCPPSAVEPATWGEIKLLYHR